jgi:RNA polymerase sigma-70 factor (ECF subfamily)
MLTDALNDVIDRVLAGDRDAFREIMHAYGLSLRSYIATQVHALDDIDDLAQDVFLAAYANLPDFRRGDDFGAWLRGIGRNKMYHHFRQTSRRNKTLDQFREQVARVVAVRLERAVSADNSGAIEMLLQCVGLLPEKLRRVVRAGLDGGKPAELAGELTTTVAAIYRLHSRANQLLRECMRKELGLWNRT